MIINPILGIGSNIDLKEITNSIIGNETVETSSDIDIADTYISSLEVSIKSQIEELGYSVNSVEIGVTSDYSDIESINIKMKSAEYDESKIKDIILENFEIDSSKIQFS